MLAELGVGEVSIPVILIEGNLRLVHWTLPNHLHAPFGISGRRPAPRSDLYLFNDPLVAENHAIIRTAGDEYEIEARKRDDRLMLNNRQIERARLRHGDQVMIGRTIFVFEKRKG
jgi:hypothetical protein